MARLNLNRRRLLATGWITALTLLLTAAAGDTTAAESETVALDLSAPSLDAVKKAPFQLGDKKAAVFIFLLTDCPITNRSAPEIRRIAATYRAKNIAFSLVYADPASTPEDIRAHLKAYDFSGFEVLVDEGHRLARATGARVTPEAVLTDAAGRIVYRGRIDDAVTDLSKPWREPAKHELCDALDAILRNKPVAVSRTQAVGCYISDLP